MAAAAKAALEKYKEEHPDAEDANIDIEPLLPGPPRAGHPQGMLAGPAYGPPRQYIQPLVYGNPLMYGNGLGGAPHHPYGGLQGMQPLVNGPLLPPRPVQPLDARELMRQHLNVVRQQVQQHQRARDEAARGRAQAQREAAQLAQQAQAANAAILHQEHDNRRARRAEILAMVEAANAEAEAGRAARRRNVRAPPPPLPAVDLRQLVQRAARGHGKMNVCASRPSLGF